MAAHKIPVSIRFWSKVDKKSNDECWEWKAVRDKNGYGTFKLDYRNGKHIKIRAHRLSWIIANGDIPRGMFICHKCDNTGCVNPNHLFLGSPKQNMDDMRTKDRQYFPGGENHYASKINDIKALEILNDFSKNRTPVSQMEIKHGVSKATIWGIIKRRTWKHIKEETS